MFDTFYLLPLPFWLSALALTYYSLRAWQQRENTIGIPMLAVLFTVAVWYGGDALYNDYTDYLQIMGRSAVELAWWEVLLFICAFGILAPIVHRSFNRKYLGRKSNLLLLARHGVKNATGLQKQLDVLCSFLGLCWAAIMLVALIRTNFDFQGLFMPYLGAKADPWSRGRVGAGFDFLISFAGYALVGLTAAIGVILALATRSTTRFLAGAIYFLAMPAFVFDRTRNPILATFLPGFCAWVFMRLRGGLIIQFAVLLVGFLVLDAWLKFVIANRSDNTIAYAFQQELSHHNSDSANAKHAGLNMFGELGYINAFIADGSYRPNWGTRYFAELVNPIPRSLWPGKPFIGIDYAIARGQGYSEAGDSQGGVGATVSTGMIGQGVVNFGRFFGPIAAALLMSYWVAILARQDLLASETGRLFLYAIGLFLTFNMGRDITLLVIYPFCFGYLLLLAVKYWQSGHTPPSAQPRAVKAGPPVSPKDNSPAILNGKQAHRRPATHFRKKGII